jgi:hypothetical protein
MHTKLTSNTFTHPRKTIYHHHSTSYHFSCIMLCTGEHIISHGKPYGSYIYPNRHHSMVQFSTRTCTPSSLQTSVSTQERPYTTTIAPHITSHASCYALESIYKVTGSLMGHIYTQIATTAWCSSALEHAHQAHFKHPYRPKKDHIPPP